MDEFGLTRRSKTAPRSLLALVAALLIAAVCAGLVANGGIEALAQEGTPGATETGSTVEADAGASIADVAEQANPAVVTVRAQFDVAGMFDDGFAQPDDPFVQPPFGGDIPSEDIVPTSSGSGFIIDEQGHVVTNHHVVAGATAFEVELFDGTVVPATLVGSDAFSDLAVLLLDLREGTSVPGTLPLGDSETVRAGDQVIAIGTPLGEYTNTVSAGIVGATDRALDTGAGYLIEDLIQHDAPVYSGSSGGPLLKLDGEVIGINTAKASSNFINADDVDIAFAISINSVKDLIRELIADGEIDRPYLGIEGRPLAEGHGVVEVAPDSPADVAGLERGDVITEVDGQPVDDENPLANLLFDHDPGDEVTLTIERDGAKSELTVTLDERPAEAA
jgi:2-alkenal reductase